MGFLNKIILFFKGKWIDFLLAMTGKKIKKVTTEKELNQACHFVWEVYAFQKKYIDPNFFPDKMFKDEFDKHSIYFLALDKNKIIGTVRLVLNSNLGFPIENLYELIVPSIEKNKIAEISRLTVFSGYEKKKIVAFGLCKKCFEESLLRGIEYWYAFLPEKLKNYFEKHGIKFIELKEKAIMPLKQKNREPYRFYFLKWKPRPYLIPLKKIPEEFKL